jgi:hypothetical protein
MLYPYYSDIQWQESEKKGYTKTNNALQGGVEVYTPKIYGLKVQSDNTTGH